jgi:glycosyltransferase involved in cell wall biosynthesis
VIFGRKFADGFVDPPMVHGPYKGAELGDRLRECDIYITASKYDSCPMHLLEALGCGLPVVYLDHPGGVKDICERTREPVGEPFNTIEECIEKIEKIKNQYEWYYNHIVNNISMYQSESCYAEYTKLFLEKRN